VYKKVICIFLLIVLLLSVCGCAQKEINDQTSEDKNYIIVQGVVEAREVDINTKIPGRIEAVPAAEGSEVKAGEVLVNIAGDELIAKKTQAEALVESARAGLEAAQAAKKAAQAQLDKAQKGAEEELIAQAKAAYDLMEKTYARVLELYEKGAVSEQKKDEAEAQLEISKQQYKKALKGTRSEDKSSAQAMVVQANAMVNAARGKLEQARGGLQEVESYLRDTSLKTPIRGTITCVNVDPGELVSSGMPILTVTDLSQPWVEVYVKETDIGLIELGQSVKVKLLSYEDKVFTGEVVRINKKPDFATKRATNANGDYDIVSFGVRVKINNEDLSLMPGMTAHVYFPKRVS
jgi:HlyD family secretion protein